MCHWLWDQMIGSKEYKTLKHGEEIMMGGWENSDPRYVVEKYFVELLPEIIWKRENVPNKLTKLGEQIKCKSNLVVTSYT